MTVVVISGFTNQNLTIFNFCNTSKCEISATSSGVIMDGRRSIIIVVNIPTIFCKFTVFSSTKLSRIVKEIPIIKIM